VQLVFWSFYTRVSLLVTPRRRLRSSVPERGTTTAPHAELQPARRLFSITAAGIRGGPNQSTPGELLPAPALAAAVLSKKQRKQQRRSKIRTQKVVRPDDGSFPDEVKLSSGRTTHGQKMNVKGNLPSSLLHWKAGDEDPPFGAGLWRRFLGEWGRRPSDQGKNISAPRRRSQQMRTFTVSL
jgi:hypothetical protein